MTITHDDPKNSDGTPKQAATYQQTVDMIGTGMLYVIASSREL
jgi:hypothetical protein